MGTVDLATLDIRGRLLEWRRLAERFLYTGAQLDQQLTLELFNTLVLADDHIAQLSEAFKGQKRQLKQMEAIARDLDPTRKVLTFGGYQPRATGLPRGEPPHQGSGGQTCADVVAFPPRRLPPRPIYEPAGPGGAA